MTRILPFPALLCVNTVIYIDPFTLTYFNLTFVPILIKTFTSNSFFWFSLAREKKSASSSKARARESGHSSFPSYQRSSHPIHHERVRGEIEGSLALVLELPLRQQNKDNDNRYF